MTTPADADRVLRAWLDLMPDEAPDRTVAAVLEAVATTPQVRRGVYSRWRFQHIHRVIALSAAAIVVAIGGAVLFGPRLTDSNGLVGAPSESPTQPPTSSTPSASPAATLAIAPLPAQLRSEWLADVESIDGLSEHDPRVRLVVSRDGRSIALQTNSFGNTTLLSIPVESTTGELRLVTAATGAGCEAGQEGQYRWTISEDGLLLGLEVIADSCKTRASAFARTWTRSLDAHSNGGRGALAAFDPVVLVTLPEASYTGSSSRDVIAVEGDDDDSTMFAMRDPWGLDNPCADGGGVTVPLKAGVDAIVAHLGTVPGLAVTSDEMTIDGRRAVHLALTTDPGIDCPAGERSLLTSKNITSGWRWSLKPGDAASLYLVELPDATYLFEYVREGVTQTDERAVMSTIRFADALPPTP